jgi:hypothetical protein
MILHFIWSILMACGVLQAAERMLPRARPLGKDTLCVQLPSEGSQHETQHNQKLIPKHWPASVHLGALIGKYRVLGPIPNHLASTSVQVILKQEVMDMAL